jgi:hypothetical protein
MTFEDQYAEKNSIVRELFIATADDNYITARWCFHQDLNVDFFWLAVHCLEKYLKASLLLNAKPATGYGHEIVKLYDSVKLLAPELLPEQLIKPENMPDVYWRPETVEQYVKRLYHDGQAHNRYQLFGYVRHAEDLWKLDQLVFNVRRLCQPLEVHFLGEPSDGVPDQSIRERMSKDHNTSWILHSKIEETISGKRGEVLQRAFLQWHFPFSRDGDRQEPTSYTSASQEPVLVRRIYGPLRAGPENYQKADELWTWVKENIELPKGFVKDIEKERVRIKRNPS